MKETIKATKLYEMLCILGSFIIITLIAVIPGMMYYAYFGNSAIAGKISGIFLFAGVLVLFLKEYKRVEGGE